MAYIKKDYWIDMTYEDLKKMNKSQLLSYTKSAIKVAKQRQSILDKKIKEKYGDYIPSSFRDFGKNFDKKWGKYARIEDLQNYGGYDFSLDKKYSSDVRYLRYKFMRAQSFINAKTSSIKGIEDTINKTISTLENITGLQLNRKFMLDPEKFSLLWNTFNKLDKSLISGQNYNAVMKYLIETINSSDVHNLNPAILYNKVKDRAKSIYEENQEKYNEEKPKDIFDTDW